MSKAVSGIAVTNTNAVEKVHNVGYDEVALPCRRELTVAIDQDDLRVRYDRRTRLDS